MWVGIIQSIEVLNRTKRWRKGKFGLYLSWDIHLLLPSHMVTPGSWVFGLDYDLNHWLPWFSDRRLTLEIPTTGFLGSPACRQKTVGLVSFHNGKCQFIIINQYLLLTSLSLSLSLFTHTHIYILLVLWRTLTNIYIVYKKLIMTIINGNH